MPIFVIGNTASRCRAAKRVILLFSPSWIGSIGIPTRAESTLTSSVSRALVVATTTSTAGLFARIASAMGRAWATW